MKLYVVEACVGALLAMAICVVYWSAVSPAQFVYQGY
jgi:hypothetical protein